ncbi:dihydroorotase [Bacillus safensis FO-36b] [Bacillus safensis subsp. safensis]
MERLISSQHDHCAAYRRRKERNACSVPRLELWELETAFPLLYTRFVKTGEWTLKELVDYMTIKPAEAFSLPYGKLEEGHIADITLIDLKKEMAIDKTSFLSKRAKYTV